MSKSSNYSNYRMQTRMTCNVDPEDDLLQCTKSNQIHENILKYDGCALAYS